MSARDIKPENVYAWLQYAQRKRDQAIGLGTDLGLCEHRHYDCAPVWNGTCVEEVKALHEAGRAELST
jgi:hypothetical protein